MPGPASAVEPRQWKGNARRGSLQAPHEALVGIIQARRVTWNTHRQVDLTSTEQRTLTDEVTVDVSVSSKLVITAATTFTSVMPAGSKVYVLLGVRTATNPAVSNASFDAHSVPGNEAVGTVTLITDTLLPGRYTVTLEGGALSSGNYMTSARFFQSDFRNYMNVMVLPQ